MSEGEAQLARQIADLSAPDRNTIAKYLADFFSIDESARQVVLEFVLPFLAANSQSAVDSVEQSLVARTTPHSPEVILSAARGAAFLVHNLAQEAISQSPAEIRTDLHLVGMVADDADPLGVDAAIAGACEKARAYAPILTRDSFSRGVLPSLTGIGSTVELRGVQSAPFVTFDELASYQPRIDGLVAIASISIQTDTDSSYYFQLDEAMLDALIAKFIATQRDLQALKASVGKGALLG